MKLISCEDSDHMINEQGQVDSSWAFFQSSVDMPGHPDGL